jgi:hypothetical protein
MRQFRWLVLAGVLGGAGLAIAQGSSSSSDAHVKVALGSDNVWESLVEFGFIFGVVAITSYFRWRKNQERLALLRLMVERGQPIDPELLTRGLSGDDARPRRRGLGLVLLLMGIAISVACRLEFGSDSAWPWGLVPASVGLALLLSLAFDRQSQS